jgi:glycerol-3-phosphate acyltransferase PlsY
VALAYLIGSVSFAVIVSRIFALPDPRSYGSGNPGATNVLRSGRRAAAALTLAGDLLKGVFAVWIARRFGPHLGANTDVVALAGLAVFLGHLYPVFFKFEGGKGVATALGVLFGISGWLGLATALTWLIIAYFFRYSSLASLVAAAFAPVYYVFGDRVAWYADKSITLALFVMAMFLAWRHRENINRLLAGKESKLGSKK